MLRGTPSTFKPSPLPPGIELRTLAIIVNPKPRVPVTLDPHPRVRIAELGVAHRAAGAIEAV